jgi:hypothetical protein
MNLGDYARAIVAAVVAAGSAFATAIDDQVLTGAEIGTIITAALVGFGLVFGLSSQTVANIKPIVGALVTLLATITTAYADKDFSGEDWAYILGAVIVAFGIIKATVNAPASIDKESLAEAASVASAVPTPRAP